MNKNPDFLFGMLFIFKKNWGLIIDKHEIDLKLSYSENFYNLMDKFVSGKAYNIEEL